MPLGDENPVAARLLPMMCPAYWGTPTS
jgi:hypothetical protein